MLTSCRADVTVAIFWALVFSMLVISSYVSLYFRHFWLCLIFICLGIFLPVHLKKSRLALAKKRERRLQLPLSMWTSMAVKSCLCTLAENGSSLTFNSFGFHFIRCLSTDIVDKDSCLPLSQDGMILFLCLYPFSYPIHKGCEFAKYHFFTHKHHIRFEPREKTTSCWYSPHQLVNSVWFKKFYA